MKTALITGSSRGLGRELAIVFAKNGYSIILHGRDNLALEGVKREVDLFGNESLIVSGDLRDKKTLEALKSAALERKVSVLINNAGSNLSSLLEPLQNLSDEQVDETIDSHLTSVIKLTKRIYPLIINFGGGAVININSVVGYEEKKGRSAYCGSKWGLRGFSESFRLEARENGVRVLEVYPTRIKTRAEFQDYGWETREAAEKIYEAFIQNAERVVLEGRPEKYRSKIALGREFLEIKPDVIPDK